MGWVTLLGLLAIAGPASDEPGATADPSTAETAPADDPYTPTSSRAPTATPITQPQPESQPEPVPVQPEPDPSLTLEGERKKAPEPDFNRHGIGFRGGIVMIPSWVFGRWLEAHTNAMCRGDTIGNFGRDHGMLKTQGCNFYAGGEYVYRYSRILDILGAVGYQRFHAPDGFWLDKGKYDGTPSSLAGADYTEMNLGFLFIEADVIARIPIVQKKNVEFGFGGGAGLGLGIVFGGVYQTAIGSAPDGYVPGQGPTPADTCQVVDDLADFSRCTPRWDVMMDPDGVPPDQSDLSDPNPDLYAACVGDNCNENDLRAFGYRKKQGDVPPVIPVVNLIISARVIIKDSFGITINGGFNTGFYFGGAFTYFFGKEFQKTPASE